MADNERESTEIVETEDSELNAEHASTSADAADGFVNGALESFNLGLYGK